MFETKNLTKEKIELRRIERKSIKTSSQKKRIKRLCKHCGNPKQTICFDHHKLPNRYTNRRIREVVPMRIRFYLRKFYFTFARILNLVE